MINPVLRKLNDWKYNNTVSKALPAPTAFEQKLIDELRSDLSGIKQTYNATSVWEQTQKQTAQFLLNEDPRKFLSYQPIIDTMFFQGSSRAVDQLISDSDFSFWRSILKEDAIGLPKPFFKYKESSGNLLQHCVSLKQVLAKAKIKVSDIHSIFEFGGGYGSFCRLVHKAGFHNQYVIFDLPIFSVLQKYYLTNLSIQSRLIKDSDNIGNNVNLVNDISVLKSKKESFSKSDLLVALWSLSECPLDLREEIFSLVHPKYILIGYQHQFSDIDNVKYFSALKQKMSNYKWFDEPISYLPGNNYLVGVLNDR